VRTKRVFKVSQPASPPSAVRARVLEAARDLFLGRGFVRVTADEIAGRVGISKATLYKEFASKEEILRAVVRGFVGEVSARVDALMHAEGLGFADKLARLFALIVGSISRFGPDFIRDLRRTAPTVWTEVEQFRRDKINTNFKAILAAGREQGLFRGDIDEDFLMRMFVRLVEEFVNPAEILRSGRTPAETFGSVIKVFFQGILTDKGRLDFSAKAPALFEPRKEGAS
jgi:AcrR family transcriptional regulator